MRQMENNAQKEKVQNYNPFFHVMKSNYQKRHPIKSTKPCRATKKQSENNLPLIRNFLITTRTQQEAARTTVSYPNNLGKQSRSKSSTFKFGNERAHCTGKSQVTPILIIVNRDFSSKTGVTYNYFSFLSNQLKERPANKPSIPPTSFLQLCPSKKVQGLHISCS